MVPHPLRAPKADLDPKSKFPFAREAQKCSNPGFPRMACGLKISILPYKVVLKPYK